MGSEQPIVLPECTALDAQRRWQDGQEQPIIVCAYSWGKESRLYHDHLYLDNKRYPLNQLISIHPIYRHVMGIFSARLELHFANQKPVILRGISAMEDAQKIVEYLSLWCEREIIPSISVPMRLLPGEHAHYSTNATLCGESTGEPTRYTYPAQDHGMLILTNKRMIYIGRKNQVVLDYTYLLHVSHLRHAIAFQADHWQKRAIFIVPQPGICAMYMHRILHQVQPVTEPNRAIVPSYTFGNAALHQTGRHQDLSNGRGSPSLQVNRRGRLIAPTAEASRSGAPINPSASTLQSPASREIHGQSVVQSHRHPDLLNRRSVRQPYRHPDVLNGQNALQPQRYPRWGKG